MWRALSPKMSLREMRRSTRRRIRRGFEPLVEGADPTQHGEHAALEGQMVGLNSKRGFLYVQDDHRLVTISCGTANGSQHCRRRAKGVIRSGSRGNVPKNSVGTVKLNVLLSEEEVESLIEELDQKGKADLLVFRVAGNGKTRIDLETLLEWWADRVERRSRSTVGRAHSG